jgi:hypothetical protein
MVGRALVALVFAFPTLGLLSINQDDIANIYLLMFVASVIPYTIFGLILFGPCDYICLKLKLYNLTPPTRASLYSPPEEKTVENDTEKIEYFALQSGY